MKRPPPWWEEHRRHLESRPSTAGLALIARAVAPGTRAVRARRLKGGLGCSTHAVTLEKRSGKTVDIVVKRFREDDGVPAREWERLSYAQRLAVPSPQALAFDAAGVWFGAPAIVMSKLPGRPLLRPTDADRFYSDIANAILAIAAVPTSRVPSALRQQQPGESWEPPEGLRHTPFSARVITAIRRSLPRALTQERVMSHGDMHPGNMLWSRGRLVGLTDWRSANLAPRTRDVVYCRAELAVLFGLREADAFLATYERLAGGRLPHVRTWDLVQGLNAIRWVQWWAHAYREQGRVDLTDEVATRRAAAFVRRALAGR